MMQVRAGRSSFDLISQAEREQSLSMRIPLVQCVLLASIIVARSAWAASYPDRFVWVFGWGLRNDTEVGEITALLETAAKSGLNGAVLSANLDTLCKEPPGYFQRLDQVKAVCDRLGLELIPSIFSVGYGGGALAHNRDLAEGLPVTDAPFLVRNGEARLVPDAVARIVNGGFEEYKVIDDDGSAYLIFEDRPAKGFHIAKLSVDYLDVEKEICLIKAPLEGGAVVHCQGLYYALGSALTGWAPNPNKYATAPSLEGSWSEFKDIAPPETKTYGSQSTLLLKVVGNKSTTVIFMGDIWKPRTQWDSRYLWMPVEIGQGKLRLPEPKEWTLDIETGEAVIKK